MLRTSLLTSLLAAAITACGGGEGTSGGEDPITPPEGPPAIALGFTDEVPAPSYVPESSFALAAVTSVRVVADWSNVTADQAQRLELRTPNGLVWTTTTIPFTGATGSDRSVTALADGKVRVVYVLEVAGTPIELQGMTGTWQATATLDGTATSATAGFALQ